MSDKCLPPGCMPSPYCEIKAVFKSQNDASFVATMEEGSMWVGRCGGSLVLIQLLSLGKEN